MTLLSRTMLAVAMSCSLAGSVQAFEPAPVAKHADLVYAEVDGHKLLLDLFVPRGVERPPLVVFIHGGSWRAGDRKRCPVSWLPQEGFALASISYRFTDRAIFPAQIHDCKAAVRWLRANADTYGYNADRIAVAGSSAGGHLAVLLGVSGDVKALEGAVGKNTDQSSKVAAIVDFYGPTDFLLRSRTHPERSEAPSSGNYQLLAGPVSQKKELATLASGVTHVSAGDPPLLILHGDKDKTVLMDQSESLRKSYQDAQLDVELVVVKGGGHGGTDFYSGGAREKIVAFLKKHLNQPNQD